MRLWPFSRRRVDLARPDGDRRAPEIAEVAPAPGAAHVPPTTVQRVLEPTWRDLPPIQRLVAPSPSVVSTHFDEDLTAWKNPTTTLAPLGHRQGGAEPAGEVDGIALLQPPMLPPSGPLGSSGGESLSLQTRAQRAPAVQRTPGRHRAIARPAPQHALAVSPTGRAVAPREPVLAPEQLHAAARTPVAAPAPSGPLALERSASDPATATATAPIPTAARSGEDDPSARLPVAQRFAGPSPGEGPAIERVLASAHLAEPASAPASETRITPVLGARTSVPAALEPVRPTMVRAPEPPLALRAIPAVQRLAPGASARSSGQASAPLPRPSARPAGIGGTASPARVPLPAEPETRATTAPFLAPGAGPALEPSAASEPSAAAKSEPSAGAAPEPSAPLVGERPLPDPTAASAALSPDAGPAGTAPDVAAVQREPLAKPSPSRGARRGVIGEPMRDLPPTAQRIDVVHPTPPVLPPTVAPALAGGAAAPANLAVRGAVPVAPGSVPASELSLQRRAVREAGQPVRAARVPIEEETDPGVAAPSAPLVGERPLVPESPDVAEALAGLVSATTPSERAAPVEALPAVGRLGSARAPEPDGRSAPAAFPWAIPTRAGSAPSVQRRIAAPGAAPSTPGGPVAAHFGAPPVQANTSASPASPASRAARGALAPLSPGSTPMPHHVVRAGDLPARGADLVVRPSFLPAEHATSVQRAALEPASPPPPASGGPRGDAGAPTRPSGPGSAALESRAPSGRPEHHAPAPAPAPAAPAVRVEPSPSGYTSGPLALAGAAAVALQRRPVGESSVSELPLARRELAPRPATAATPARAELAPARSPAAVEDVPVQRFIGDLVSTASNVASQYFGRKKPPAQPSPPQDAQKSAPQAPQAPPEMPMSEVRKLAHRIYPLISQKLKAELGRDRERAGMITGLHR